MNNENNISSGISYINPARTENENYTNSRSIQITNLVNESRSFPLAASNYLGLQLNLQGDKNIDNKGRVIRCFWAKEPSKNAYQPLLYYYYYTCGDVSTQSVSGDDFVNRLVNCYTRDTIQQFCRSKFTQRKSMNPYVEGVWGNWRVDSAFVYYGKRKETDPSVNNLDMRTAGAIDGFKTFWNFNNAKLNRNYSASDVWTWNSVITQYNRKGYDIENKDPLGRFNAGLYGYNQQLPIAVVNNSRYREAMFDGFEDYGYQSASCTETCKPPKHARVKDALTYIDSTQKHTGKHSLRVGASSFIELNAPVVDSQSLEKPYSVRVRMDSTSYTITTVNGAGSGLRGYYYQFPKTKPLMTASAIESMLNAGSGSSYFKTDRLDPNIDLRYNNNNQYLPGLTPPVPSTMAADNFAVRWKGWIQAPVSGTYVINAVSDDGMRIKMGTSEGTATTIVNNWDGINQINGNFTMTAGTLYWIQVDHYEHSVQSGAVMKWKRPDQTELSFVPSNLLYTPENVGNASGTVTSITKWCTKLDTVQVRGEALTDTFSLIQGKKMLVSAWVKEGGNDCKCSTYANNSITVQFTGSGNQFTFTPTGSIIEGWQRYEGVFTIPSSATAIKVKMNSTGSNTCYFDDLRIHPFNANMKSFVYNPSNLRLMAELDENNYGSLYEYDDDGTLIRVKKETERGIKTITETRSALQKAIE